MNTIMRIIGFITLCCGYAAAQNTQLDIRYFAPQPGYWVSDTQQRNAYGIQVGPDGYLFAAIYTYDQMGMPTFLTVQGEITPATVAQRASGLLSTFSSATFRTTNGTPFGGQQTGTPTTVESEFGAVQMRFFVWGEGDLTVGGQTLPIKPFPLYVNGAPFQPDAIANGVWAMVGVNAQFPSGNYGIVKVRVSRQQTTNYTAASASAGPAPGEIQYSVTCLACDVVRNAVVDPALTTAANNVANNLLITYSATDRRWRSYNLSANRTRYFLIGNTSINDSSIQVYESNSDGLFALARLPAAMDVPGVLVTPPPPPPTM